MFIYPVLQYRFDTKDIQLLLEIQYTYPSILHTPQDSYAN